MLAHPTLTGLDAEASLVLALARRRMPAAEQDRVRDHLREHGRELDWGAVVDKAARHGVLPLIGRNLLKHRLVHGRDGRTFAPYRWLYSFVYAGNQQRNLALADEYGKVLRELNANGVAYAVRKGPALVEGVYQDSGLRRMGDLDLLLRREDFGPFTEVVRALGFQEGHLSANGEQVLPFDRSTRITWKVTLPNSTLPFLKPAWRDDVEVFVLDPCFNLFQPRSGIQADMGAVLDRAVPATHFGEPSRELDPVDQVVDACVQLHVEATTFLYIEIGKDLTLLKFLDLVELLRRLSAPQFDILAARVADLGCGDSVAYALHHAALVYPGEIDGAVLSRFLSSDQTFFDTFGVLDEHPRQWASTFAERLFDDQRWRELPERSTVPGPRAVV